MAQVLINTVGGDADPLAVIHGGTGLSGTATLTAGTGISITGTWPNQTVTLSEGPEGGGTINLVADASTTVTSPAELLFAGTGAVVSNSGGNALVTITPGAGVALLATQNAFTSSQGGPSAALTDGTTITWDASSIQLATLTINGNRTLANPTNLSAKTYALIVTQGSGGNHTLAYGSAFLWAGGSGSAFVLSTTSGAIDVVTWISDGTHMLGTGLSGFA